MVFIVERFIQEHIVQKAEAHDPLVMREALVMDEFRAVFNAKHTKKALEKVRL